jgi:hypothetical protein
VLAGAVRASAADFPAGHDEWVFAFAPDRAGRITGAEVGSDQEEGGGSTIRASLVKAGRGVEALALDYDVKDTYVYASLRREARIRHVETWPLARRSHLSFFVRGLPGTYLEITARQDRTHASRWRVTLPESVGPTQWTNVKLAVADLGRVSGRQPAQEVEALVFALVRREQDAVRPLVGRLELALLSFTDDPTALPSLPALDPATLPRFATFQRLRGPDRPSPVPGLASPTTVERYATGGPSRLALLVSDENSDWLGLAHGLHSLGVPLRVVRSAADAVHHRAVVVYPSPSRLHPADRNMLAEHVRAGGSLVAFLDAGDEDTDLAPVLGARVLGLASECRGLVLEPMPHGPGAAFAPEVEDREIPVHDEASGTSFVPCLSLRTTATGVEAIGRWDRDQTVAVTRRVDGSAGGRAYAWGLDAGRLLLAAQNDRARGVGRKFVNHYLPAGDVVLRFLSAVHREAAPRSAVRVRTAPHGREVPVLLTHDVDESAAVGIGEAFAASEQRQGVPATYFLLTKYGVPEFDDDAYVFHTVGGRTAASAWKSLDAAGHEVASHSVVHAPDFETPGRWPMGDGKETFELYYPTISCEGPPPPGGCDSVPKVQRCRTRSGECGVRRTADGSLLGELRVSRRIVEEVASQPVRSFRPGFLYWPDRLAEAAAAAGYMFTSIGTCNSHLTHLPYQLNASKGRGEVDVYEFCVGSDDQDQPLDATDEPGTRLHQALDLARRLSSYGGIFVQLIHPAKTWSSWQENLSFQEALVSRLQAIPGFAHFDTVRGFGDFWRARDAVQVDVSPRGEGSWRLRVEAPRAVTGLSFDVPATWRTLAGEGATLDAKRHVLVVDGPLAGVLEIDVRE